MLQDTNQIDFFSAVAVFLVTFLLLGNVMLSFMIVAVVIMIEVDVVGVMVLWGTKKKC
jgi:uncharacterized iron-regulated membrane protein